MYHPPLFTAPHRIGLAAALLSSLALGAAAAPITAIQGKRSSTTWTTPGAPATNESTLLLAFTVGGTRYSTGVDDSLVTAPFNPASFHAFTAPTIAGSQLTAWGSAMPIPSPYPALTWFLSDGTQGLELATALFNAPAQDLNFPIQIPSTANLTLPAIITTQMGAVGASDTYYFVNSAGNTVGNALTVSYGAITPVGKIHWTFRTAAGSTSGVPADGDRDLRMLSYSLADFGLTAATVGQVAAFRQRLNGASDLAFVAYNRDLMAVQAPDLAIDLTGLGSGPLALGTPYSGSFSCTNIGATSATEGTSCSVTGLPAGLAVGACTLTGGTAWVAGDAIAVGSAVTCTVSGTPTAVGTSTVAGSTTGSSTSMLGGNPVVTADADLSNNSATVALQVVAPDMQVASVNLPAGIEGTAYAGSFSCTNAGNADAANASCTPTGLPAWASVSCSPATPMTTPLAVGGTISCTVSGTPPTGSHGSSPVTVTASTSSAESDPDNNVGSGSLVVSGVPDVQIDLAGLPPTGTVGQPYSGIFSCTNHGTADAEAAACSIAGLPAGVTAGACSISPDDSAWTAPATIPEGQTVTCTVEGTPTEAGVSDLTGTGGIHTATQTVTVSAAAPPAPIPPLTHWALVLMAGLLAMLGRAGARRTG
jgi:hypothetical protein